MSALLLTVFVASLVGSLHCAGMCGPFVAFAVSRHPRLASRGAIELAPQLAYHGGRLAMYAGLGGLAGLLGGALNQGGALAGIEHAAAIAAGATLVLIGVALCLQQFSLRLPGLRLPRAVRAVVDAGVRYAGGMRPVQRAGLIGLLTAILPCGWLYGFVVAAAGTGGAAAGAALMTAFWAGTVPVLAGLGATVQGASRLLGARVQLVASVALVLLGVLTAWGRLSAFDAIHAAAAVRPASVETLAADVEQMDSSEAPCCRSGP